ncbi:MAG TPA: hypothetical protein VFA41_17125 [Ktedonobacteraceae bacterium]|nr:hypothetical protein [Ktedonobacteraceae bacterium]
MSKIIEDPELRARTLASIDLLKRLPESYQACLHGSPCEVCGSVIWTRVARGFRCLVCWLPPRAPNSIRQQLRRLLV